ncbi:restriction endonuclease subunit S [Phocaeicola vulgatus]|uniref:restriction endonuclease subunit S n=2 Tax=Bacteroidales TaxID=171549 RepID=UPI001F3B2270|nr:restriction endonuclease subunit S [Phocaeicola vulgatus]
MCDVPALRFPEFTEEWKRIKVSDLLDFYSTNSLSWEQLEYESNEPYNLHYGLIHVGLPTIIDLTKDKLPSIKDGNVPKKYELCKEGDIAFADASEDTNEVAKVVEFYNLDGKKVVCGLHTIHGRDNNKQTAKGFLGYCFSSTVFHYQIRRIAQGTKIYSINTRNFSEAFVGLPSKSEQHKIATLLKLIDERISTQNKIIEKYESLIQAMCDNLIEREIQQVTLSFSDFGQSYSGLSGKNAEDFGEGYPFITYMNVYQNQIIDSTDVGLVKINETEQQSVVHYGDILLTLSSETPEEVGMGAVYLGETYPLYLNSFCFGIHITDEAKIYPPFLAYYVSSQSFRKAVYPLAQGSTRFNLQKSDFMKKHFSFPMIEKQRKIYSILKAYSDKLIIEKLIMRLLCKQKCYLLRQLFI